MKRPLSAGAGGLALALCLAVSSIAPMARAQSTPEPIVAAPGAFSVEDTSIGDMLANPAARAVLEKDMPALIAYPGLDLIVAMTLRQISVYPETQLDEAKLTAIQKDLDAASK